MPRIRSLHPGLFTDDRYMGLTLAARELLKGLWCEADDQGVFEWRPLTLKARIMPADNVDVEAILVELAAAMFLRGFTINGKNYGAIRNFRRFQRPKRPTEAYHLPDELRNYVGLGGENPPSSDDNAGGLPHREPPNGEDAACKSGNVPHTSPTEGGNPPQMKEKEEGVGVGKEVKEESKKTAPRGAAAVDYEFAGRLIRLKRADLAGWRKTYHAIPDIEAELRTLDAYYDAELTGRERGRWFIRCSAALDKKHQAALAARARPNGGLLPNEGVF